MMRTITGHWLARCVQVVAALQVADALWEAPQSPAMLATDLGVDEHRLTRLLRALATVDIFRETADGTFSNTELSATLAARHPHTVGSVARLFGSPWHHKAWLHLEDALRQELPAFDVAHSQGLVAYLEDHPDDAEVFNVGMGAIGRLSNRAILAVLPNAAGVLRGLRVVSISGGHSELPIDLIDKRIVGHLSLVDRPAIIDRWRRTRNSYVRDGFLDLLEAPIPDGILDAIQPGSTDVVILDRVLHDWNDSQATSILKEAGASLAAGGKIVVIDQSLASGDERTAFLDLQMLVHRGGAERSREAVEELAQGAGLTVDCVHGTFSPMNVTVLKYQNIPQESGDQS